MKQPPRYALIADRRTIIDRRALAERLAALPDDDLQRQATELAADSAGVRAAPKSPAAWPPSRPRPGDRRLLLPSLPTRSSGSPTTWSPSAFIRARRRRLRGCRSSGLAGTGRGEMAPFSDLDLMFLVADRGSPLVRASDRGAALHVVGPEAEGRPIGPHRRPS